jgi:hypothetical protein
VNRGYLTRKAIDLLKAAGVTDRDERLLVYQFIAWRPNITSTNDLNDRELQAVVDVIDYWTRYLDIKEMVKMRLPG